jgi:23S rRNA pseudouridine1911/1915/1917 synthase
VIHQTVIKTPPSGLEIIYEDEYLLAVNKPTGLLSVATDTEKEKTAFRLLKDSLGSPIYVVHRLDRETSGVLLFAKSAEIRDALQAEWDRTPRREYLAVCEGVFNERKGRRETVFNESSAHRVYSINAELTGEGRRAVTNYEVLRDNGKYSLLRIRLETGRKNQIRVHMQEMGHPVAGDKKYGATGSPLGRLGLHASLLEAIHPVTKRPLIIEAKPDKKFKLPKPSR